MSLDRMRVAEITGLLAHVAGILDALPLPAYADAIQADADSVSQAALDTSAGRFRRARRAELMAAAHHAGEFVQAMQASVAHFRAAQRAEKMEYELDEAEPPTLRVFSDADARNARQAYPGHNVISINRREEALPDDGPQAS